MSPPTGKRYKEIQARFQEKVIPLYLYIDAFAINNACGSKGSRHKMTAAYISVHVAPSSSSLRRSIMLLGLSDTDHLSDEAGYDTFMDNLVGDINRLSQTTFNFCGEVVRVVLVAVECDNLEGNRAAGLASSFSPKITYLCRSCTLKTDDMKKCLSWRDMCDKRDFRTPDTYRDDLREFEQNADPIRSRGVRYKSPFSAVNHLNIATDIVPDYNHNFSGGVGKKYVLLALVLLHEKGLMYHREFAQGQVRLGPLKGWHSRNPPIAINPKHMRRPNPGSLPNISFSHAEFDTFLDLFPFLVELSGRSDDVIDTHEYRMVLSLRHVLAFHRRHAVTKEEIMEAEIAYERAFNLRLSLTFQPPDLRENENDVYVPSISPKGVFIIVIFA